MKHQVVILHGWSDNSRSFEPLAKFLEGNGYKTVPLFLGDYKSLRDDVKIDDVAKRMEEVIREKMGRPVSAPDRLNKSFDLIVHSTGGLVARRWISMHYTRRRCPVHNLIMLAPANFGSKLAHKGRSMLGRVFKGWKTGFETGEEMLYALELSSPFLWDLSQADLFLPEGSSPAQVPVFYAPDKVRPFVIVGTHPYTSLVSALTNENGSDGTVRVAAANLNAYGKTVDFSGDVDNLLKPRITNWSKRGGEKNLFPLAVLPDRTHGSIIKPDKLNLSMSKLPEMQKRLGLLILQALRTETPEQYSIVHDDWKKLTHETRNYAGDSRAALKNRIDTFKKPTPREYFHEYFQICVQVEDEFGKSISDYFLTFVPKQKQHWYSLRSSFSKEGVYFHKEVLEHTHVHRRATANRCLFIDRFDLMSKSGFYKQIEAEESRQLHFAVSATDPGDRIAYFSRESKMKRGLVNIHDFSKPGERWLKRHSTHFIRIIIPRVARPNIFTIRRA